MFQTMLLSWRRNLLITILSVLVLTLIVVFFCNASAFAAISGFIQTAKLTASDGAAGDIFGRSVDIDANAVVIGAYGKNDMGAAYVYERNGGAWTQTAKLAPAELEEGDLFGLGVSISGDTVVVGAWGDDDVEQGGAAYVFEKTGGVWTQTAKLTADTGRG